MKAPRILVVDDEAHILEVLEMRLGALGLDVAAARTAREALEALDAQPFDVALFDLRMAPVDGLTLMESAHARQPRLPVLIMTAHGTIETAVEAIRRGAFDYLTKPFVAEELRVKIGRALSARRWARDRQLLKTVGEALGSLAAVERTLEAVAQATVEATEAERAVVFLLDGARLTAATVAGGARGPLEPLEEAARAALDKRGPTRVAPAEGPVLMAVAFFVDAGPAGVLVVESAPGVLPTPDDLELLAVFSSQAQAALRNAHEFSRLRSGALAALGRMAAEVAHELKNPLGGLKLYARYLEQRLEQSSDAEGLAVAQKLGRAIDDLARTVTEITAFGRPVELRREPTAVNTLLEECLGLAQDRVEAAGAAVVRDLDQALPLLWVDPRQLKKVLLNLVVNGLDALQAGGTLTVRSRRVPDGVEVVVEDTGAGMTEETRARIFDPFFTTKPEGTGLGMSIARSIVDRHRGRLSVSSEAGRGTQVTVWLPGEPA
jgi:signal transduction histidine kinase